MIDESELKKLFVLSPLSAVRRLQSDCAAAEQERDAWKRSDALWSGDAKTALAERDAARAEVEKLRSTNQELGIERDESDTARKLLQAEIERLRGLLCNVVALEPALSAMTPGPYQACGEDRGYCQCGMVWAGEECVAFKAYGPRNTGEPDYCPTEEQRAKNAAGLVAVLNALPGIVAAAKAEVKG